MKKIFLVCLLILVAGCSSNYNSVGSPPPVSMKIGDTSHSMKRGSYSWSKQGLFQTESIIADAASPYQIGKEMEPITVEKNSVLEIETSGNPTLSAYLWDYTGRTNDIPITDHQITAPDESGEYIYEVFGEWEKGDGSYTIVLKVE
ncbi:hypothetical protein [Ornithinibacillus sp. 179-J 7C1 HS]|uniref:hypothetical protein n=1 Tax=Ornithinibacillus sp. 179-J 7C1 HS TaxID=3142384 RepID=UPI0039A08C25